MTAVATKSAGVIAINTNTVIGIVSTLIGGLVLYMITTGMGQVKQTATDVKEVKTVLPYMQHSIDATAADIKEVKQTAVTRSELESKNNRLQDSLKEIQTEQVKVRDDLLKTMLNPPKPHE